MALDELRNLLRQAGLSEAEIDKFVKHIRSELLAGVGVDRESLEIFLKNVIAEQLVKRDEVKQTHIVKRAGLILAGWIGSGVVGALIGEAISELRKMPPSTSKPNDPDPGRATLKWPISDLDSLKEVELFWEADLVLRFRDLHAPVLATADGVIIEKVVEQNDECPNFEMSIRHADNLETHYYALGPITARRSKVSVGQEIGFADSLLLFNVVKHGTAVNPFDYLPFDNNFRVSFKRGNPHTD